MDTALIDLGNANLPPTFNKAMKGYIALSRATKVQDMLLVQPFSPALFRQGPQPWPTLLRDVLLGEVSEEELNNAALKAEKRIKKPVLLTDLRWTCATCKINPEGNYKKFMSGQTTKDEWYKEYSERIIKPGAHRKCWECAPGASTERTLQCEF